MNSWGFFVQDNWRVRNNLTINAGLRYELQTPFVAHNNSYSTATLADLCGVSGIGADGGCNLFKPGTLTGQTPQLVNYSKGTPAFKTDRNNFAPSLGMTWRPSRDSGMLRKLFGPRRATRCSSRPTRWPTSALDMGLVRRSARQQPRRGARTRSATRRRAGRTRSTTTASGCRCCSGRRARLGPGGVPERADLSADRRAAPTRSTSSTRTSRRRTRRRGPAASAARSRATSASRRATSAPATCRGGARST